jgi:hypothetical protein
MIYALRLGRDQGCSDRCQHAGSHALPDQQRADLSQVPGVSGQTIRVTNYVQAELLTELLNLAS